MGDIVNGTQGTYMGKGMSGKKRKTGKERQAEKKIGKNKGKKDNQGKEGKRKENKTIGKRNINGAPAYFFPISSEKNKEQEKKKRERK